MEYPAVPQKEGALMSRVLVMADTIACVPLELADRYKIKVVPAANIFYDNQTFMEGITISAAEAYALLRKDPDKFMTSAITPGYLADQYRKLSAESDSIFFVSVSSSLSAVSKTAELAGDLVREGLPLLKVKVFNSKSVAGGEGMIALEAAKAAAGGMALDDIAGIAEKTKQRTRVFMLLDTLRYVYRTGRMSRLGSKIASMFNIKPILQITNEGRLEMVDRTRNTEHGLERIIELIKEAETDKALHFWISHADAPERANIFADMLKRKFNCLSIVISDFSPVMGYGSGPGAIVVGFHPEINLR
jgi:DegV family protein with EDD domain